jgi:hypothetical protein
MKDTVKPSIFFGGMLLCTGLSFAQSAKVPVCHIPPGNPAQAKTLQVGAAAVNAHLAHGDFAGDCWAGQTAGTVIMFQQGLQNNGTPVASDRSNPNQALGTPDCNNQPGQFVSLGFGGYIILEMNGGILNIPGNDLRICETTFGPRSCSSYPETARIFVSQDLSNWTDLGTICQDGEVDIAPLNWIRFVKIVDETDPTAFGTQVVDGFDVDGIQRIMPPAAREAVAGSSLREGDFFQPNPVQETLQLDLSAAEEDNILNIRISDLQGRILQETKLLTDSRQTDLTLDCRGLPQGQLILTVEGAGLKETRRILKD